MIACDLVAALMALFWSKPVAARTVKQSQAMLEETVAASAKLGGARGVA
jgi:hypothetical protein